MSGKRIVAIETVCEHGDTGPHGIGVNARIAGRVDCPGGSRRTLTEGQYVLIEKADGEWPAAAMKAVGESMFGNAEMSGAKVRRHRYAWEQVALGVLDALSDHTEGTP